MKYESDGGGMVGEFVCVCMYVHAQVSEWGCEWVMWVWCVCGVSEWVGGDQGTPGRTSDTGEINMLKLHALPCSKIGSASLQPAKVGCKKMPM